MVIKTISYSQSKESVINGLKRWDKVELVGELQEMDYSDSTIHANTILADCFHYLKTKADEFLNSIKEKNESPNEKQQPPSEINLAHERIQIAIENAKTREDLCLIKEDVEKANEPNLLIAFMIKAKSIN